MQILHLKWVTRPSSLTTFSTWSNLATYFLLSSKAFYLFLTLMLRSWFVKSMWGEPTSLTLEFSFSLGLLHLSITLALTLTKWTFIFVIFECYKGVITHTHKHLYIHRFSLTFCFIYLLVCIQELKAIKINKPTCTNERQLKPTRLINLFEKKITTKNQHQHTYLHNQTWSN